MIEREFPLLHSTPPHSFAFMLDLSCSAGIANKGLCHGSGIFYLYATENLTEATNSFYMHPGTTTKSWHDLTLSSSTQWFKAKQFCFSMLIPSSQKNHFSPSVLLWNDKRTLRINKQIYIFFSFKLNRDSALKELNWNVPQEFVQLTSQFYIFALEISWASAAQLLQGLNGS